MRPLIQYFASEETVKSKAFFGIIAPTGGLAVSTISNVEMWLRLMSLSVGIVVGVLSAASLSVGLYRKLKNKNEDY
jgi:hypothetical protein